MRRHRLRRWAIVVLLAACGKGADMDADDSRSELSGGVYLVPTADVAAADVVGVGDVERLYANVDDGTGFDAADNRATQVKSAYGVPNASYTAGYAGQASGIVTHVVVGYRARRTGSSEGSLKVRLLAGSALVGVIPATRPDTTWTDVTASFDVPGAVSPDDLRTRLVFVNTAGFGSISVTQIWLYATIVAPPTPCGDGVCGTGEDCLVCAGDCGACQLEPCGDGRCASQWGESCQTCPADCGGCSPACGDGQCSSAETCVSCPSDCPASIYCPPRCADGTCAPGEDCASCPQDCGYCCAPANPVCGSDLDRCGLHDNAVCDAPGCPWDNRDCGLCGGDPNLFGCGGACCPLGARCVDGECRLPDLRPDPNWLIPGVSDFGGVVLARRVFGVDSCELEEACITGPGERTLLEFNLVTMNDGPGDLIVGRPQDNPLFRFNECHDHYHFQDFATFALEDLAGREVVPGLKQNFCLMGTLLTGGAIPHWGQCNVIPAGAGDMYGVGTPCQWIDVTGVAPGDYVLRISVNPAGTLAETNYANNTIEVPIPLTACGNGRCDGLESCSSCPADCSCASCVDGDRDGYSGAVATDGACPFAGRDCDDTNPSIHAGVADICDGIDDDCDGRVDEDCFMSGAP